MKQQAEARGVQGCSNERQVRNGAGPGRLLPTRKAEPDSGVLDRPVSRAVGDFTLQHDAAVPLAETVGGPTPRAEKGLRC